MRELQRDGTRTIELAAAADYAPNDIAAAFADTLGRPVAPQVVERDQWRQTLARIGLPPAAVGSWEEMWEGFNTGHIRFENTPERGRTSITDFAKAAVAELGTAH
ncbi:hypothetical protein ACFOSC_11610 [Streptantibioticus rubrisoli]|uniref:NmrA-like family protein n=1 Tax=Streptantibioticus rubrisoli TaxID=1387313 RepID=A0ABT1PEG7_9ACTN|nr:hypothetical protein [Streptantibioticus rubrisoli]MCQ4043759.1 hypothetical protein [Streptantibioticus rubrisoli]